MTANSEKHIPMRRCVGCMKSRPQNEMIRIGIRDGKLTADPDRGLPGRGIYLCPEEECLKRAVKRKSFSRALKQGFDGKNIEALEDQITQMISGDDAGV